MLSSPPVPFHEIVLAPTNRAKCGCKQKHPIAMGELKLVSWYLPRGRNHMESTSKALVCIPTKTAAAVLVGKTEAGLDIIDRTAELANPAAHATAKAIAEAIAAGKTISAELRAFRQTPPPKPRAPKRPAPEATSEAAPVAPEEKRKCFKCNTNFARSQEEGATCNSCRPEEEKTAESAAKKAASEAEDAREAFIEEKVEAVVASLPTNCPCGNRARRWRSFQSFLDELEGMMTRAALETVYASDEKEDAHLDTALEKYKLDMAAMLHTDPLCNACAAAKAE